MSRASDEDVVRHFFDSDERIFIEELNESNKEEYINYLMEYDRVDVRSSNRHMMVGRGSGPGLKSSKRKEAEKRAEKRLESDDDYFLMFDNSERKPVFGQAANIIEDGATETRISIDDGAYRGIENTEGESVYDLANKARFPAAEGNLYVCTMNKKAQYKLENMSHGGKSFKVLKWAPNFKREPDPGTIMALENRGGEPPETLFIPEMGQEGNIEDFINRRLDEFHEGPVETELKSDVRYEDLKASGRYDFSEGSNLYLRAENACNGNKCYSVTSNGSSEPEDIVKELEENKERSTTIIEARLDVEVPQAVYVADELLEEGWLPSGFVPDIGGGYDSYELSLIFPKEPIDFHITEGVRELYDTMDIPYRKLNEGDSLEDSKSIPVEVGVYPREISETGITHAKLFDA